jgi:hypothetical protein
MDLDKQPHLTAFAIAVLSTLTGFSLVSGCTNRQQDCEWLATCAESGAPGLLAPENVAGSSGTAKILGSAGATPNLSRDTVCPSRCEGKAPICDVSTRHCVECSSTSNCPAERPVCQAASGNCVECSSPSNCPAERPVCQAASGNCVECLKDNDCGSADKPWCLTATQSCVGCISNAHCPSDVASRCDSTSHACVACESSADCNHISGRGVCAGQRCVQCTSTDASACVDGSGRVHVCDSTALECAPFERETAGLCQPCVSDAQCKPGLLCYAQQLDHVAVGHFCFRELPTATGSTTAPSCLTTVGRPYINIEVGVTSIDGKRADLCTLRTSSCLALAHFGDTLFDCSATDTDAANAKCGSSALNDGQCVPSRVDANRHICTTTCISSEDCPNSVGVACDKGTNPWVCTVP